MQLDHAAIVIILFFQQPPHRGVILMRVDFQAFNPALSAQVFRLFQNPAGDPPAFEFVID